MIPDRQSIFLPFLKLLADSKEWSFQNIIENLANTFKVSHDERQEMIPSGQRIFDYRVGYSRTVFKRAGLLQSTRLGYMRITSKGLNFLANNPDYIDLHLFNKSINSSNLRRPKKREGDQNFNLAKLDNKPLKHKVQEKDFEDIVCKYPELIEDGLELIDRQRTLYGRRINILFLDKFKRKLILELKIGLINDEYLENLRSYEGVSLSKEDSNLRVMLVGTQFPPIIQQSLDHYGIAWKEISINSLKSYLNDKKDNSFIKLFEYKESASRSPMLEDLIARLKSSEEYKSFKGILHMKNKNEAKAKTIIEENTGRLTYNHLREIIVLVDEPYPCISKGKIAKGPWFGRLLKSNTVYIFNEVPAKINNWFNILADQSYPVEKKIDLLLNEPSNIKGLSIGFITLMLYIIDKTEYLIWFQGQHEGLSTIYPDLKKYTGNCNQYLTFNRVAKEFAKQYGFEHSELDWVFSTGVYLTSSTKDYYTTNKNQKVWAGLDQSKHNIEQIFENQKASDEVERFVLAFHENLVRQLTQKNIVWSARTHVRGISYLCNDRKAFLALNVFQQFTSIKFFTGNNNIDDLKKGTWVNKDDKLSSEPFRIVDNDSLNQAVHFAIKAHQIASDWTENSMNTD